MWSKLVHHWRSTHRHDFPIVSLLQFDVEEETLRHLGPLVDQQLVGLGDGQAPWNLGGVLSTVRYQKILRGAQGPFELSHMCAISQMLFDYT